MHKRKLIEVALPLEAINRESAREKSIRHGHPSTVHLWWARRPLATARAMLFAQLVDDPSARPDEFPTEALQRTERQRLHELLERLVQWDTSSDERLLDEARREILRSTEGNPPPILDPFAGGGTIPLEAQRLGLESYASDLNPVAVLINKALIELPPKFLGQPPVFPGSADAEIRVWARVEGLAADVRSYGQWVRERAAERLGHHYPEAKLSDGSRAAVIAWIWARTVRCPNPACGIDMPLVRSWWLGQKKGKETHIVPIVEPDSTHPSRQRVRFEVKTTGKPVIAPDGTVSGRTGGVCVACESNATVDYIRSEGKAGRLGQQLMAMVVEKDRQRLYVAADAEHSEAAQMDPPLDTVTGEIADNPRWFSPPGYGLTQFADLFTNRQLTALTSFSDLVGEARAQVVVDACSAGVPDPEAYADAVATYLAFGVDKIALTNVSLAAWQTNPERLTQAYSRQAIPMTWDFAEANPLSSAGGGYGLTAIAIAKVLERLVPGAPGSAGQGNAIDVVGKQQVLLATDPPYYDNIGYSDLSDFFYVWLRRTLRDIYPDLLPTMLVPKAEELVANPYRHDGKDGAQRFFEDGFRQVFARARESAVPDFPITVYYAFKQRESSADGTASTGWETLLEGMIRSGWSITSTWPVRTELVTSLKSTVGALASSIVLSLRPRAEGASTIDRRGFIAALEAELPDALRKLQQGQVAPVDLPQAAIGPGMAVFSRYAGVIESDGSKMTVRSALARINEILDQVVAEQEGDFDATTRFAIAWYRQYGYGVGKFGDADNLARARNTSVDTMDRDEILKSRAGQVHLIKPTDLPWDYDVLKDAHTSNWEALHHLVKVLERDGIAPAGDFLQAALARPDGAIDADLIKELAHLLFHIAEGNGWTKDALSFNTLVTSWPEILEVARSTRQPTVQQGSFDFDDGDE